MSVGEVCGAVSGGVMAVGLLYGQDGKQVVRSMTHGFVQKFTERNNALRCRDLLGLDLNTAEGVQAYRSQNLNTRCSQFVSSAVATLFDLKEKVLVEGNRPASGD